MTAKKAKFIFWKNLVVVNLILILLMFFILWNFNEFDCHELLPTTGIGQGISYILAALCEIGTNYFILTLLIFSLAAFNYNRIRIIQKSSMSHDMHEK